MVVKDASMQNVDQKTFDERVTMQLKIKKSFKDLLVNYSDIKEVSMNQVLTRLIRDVLASDELQESLKKIQPLFSKIDDVERTPFRLDEDATKKFKKLARENNGRHSSFMNAVLYNFFKHGDFENLPEMKLQIDNHLKNEK